MSMPWQTKHVLTLSLPLFAFIVLFSCVGILSPEFYSAETLNWQAQSIAQDFINLFLIAPCLLITAILVYRKNKSAFPVWGGIVLYLTYTFVIYCFEIHFNQLFIFYCFALGLSFYSLLFFLFKLNDSLQMPHIKTPLTRVIGIYFILVSVLFYLLWLSEIVPAIIQHTLPKSLAQTGLITNAVHVIDLSVILPAIFLTGIFLLKGKLFGFLLTPVILTFFVLMDITIGFLSIFMHVKGIESSLALSIIMAFLALFSLILLILFFRRSKSSIV